MFYKSADSKNNRIIIKIIIHTRTHTPNHTHTHTQSTNLFVNGRVSVRELMYTTERRISTISDTTGPSIVCFSNSFTI